MSNLFLEDLKYLSIAEFKSSSNSSLANSWDNELIQIWIAKAEFKIDSLISTWCVVPENNLKKAVILLTENIYKWYSDLSQDKAWNIVGELTEIKHRWHTRKYASSSTKFSTWDSWDWITDEIRLLLWECLISTNKARAFRT